MKAVIAKKVVSSQARREAVLVLQLEIELNQYAPVF